MIVVIVYTYVYTACAYTRACVDARLLHEDKIICSHYARTGRAAAQSRPRKECKMASEKSSAKKTLSIIGNVFIWIFIVFAVVVTIFAFASQGNSEGVPVIGGKGLLKVQTDSMEPVYKAGDLIIGTQLDPAARTQLQVNDIITFKTDINGDGQNNELKTHRIVEVITEDGTVTGYYTKGDHNPMVDADPDTGKPALVRWQDVLFKHTEKGRIPVLGSVLDFLNTRTGFMVCVVIPLALFFILELVSFIRKFVEVKNDGKKKVSEAELEAMKLAAIEEAKKQLAAEAAEKEAAEKAEAAKTEEVTEAKAEEAAPEETVGEAAAEAEAEHTPEETVEDAVPAAEEATAEPSAETGADETEAKTEE